MTLWGKQYASSYHDYHVIKQAFKQGWKEELVGLSSF